MLFRPTSQLKYHSQGQPVKMPSVLFTWLLIGLEETVTLTGWSVHLGNVHCLAVPAEPDSWPLAAGRPRALVG